MRKLLLFILLGVSVLVNAQDVKVDINRNDVSSKRDCSFEINGICSTEDVGGVDAQVQYVEDPGHTRIFFTNYNEKTVTVTYMIGNSCNSMSGGTGYHTADGTTGSMVLRSNETKYIVVDYYNYDKCYFISGLISRFLKTGN